MKEELPKKLVAFQDAVKENGNTTEAIRFLGELKEAVLQGALENITDEYQDQLFDLINDITAIDTMNEFNRSNFESTVALIEDTLYDED